MDVLKVLAQSRPLRSLRVMTFVFGTTAVASWTPAVAHHSFAPMPSQDGGPIVEVFEGTVELYRLINPHSALIVNIRNDRGVMEGRLVELSSAARLVRAGWTDDSLHSGDQVTIAIEKSYSPNRGRLRAVLVHGASEADDARLLVGYGIFPRQGLGEDEYAQVPPGRDASIMSRLRERLPSCGEGQSECFTVTGEALEALREGFPGEMGYVQ